MTPITGTISLGDIRTELGGSGPISLGDTNVRQLVGQTSGQVDLVNGRACEWIATNQENLVVHTYVGSPSTATTYRIVVPAGVTIGGTSPSGWNTYALMLGSFPAGSNVTLDNYGYILGAGGTGGLYAGGSGGSAVYAYYTTFTGTVNNMSSGLMYGGGGGGGRGGTGGKGGTGGQGVYYTQNVQYSPYSYVWYDDGAYGGVKAYWASTLVYAAGAGATSGNGYYRGSYVGQVWVPNGKSGWYRQMYQIWVYVANYTSGGTGGNGGAGGNGGRGEGYNQTRTFGSGGAAGAAGSAGGTNAGAGGQGGTGGSGGYGGLYGNAGSNGLTGNTGATGQSGNYTAGLPGSAGASPYVAGASGRYLTYGTATFSFNNFGNLKGTLYAI